MSVISRKEPARDNLGLQGLKGKAENGEKLTPRWTSINIMIALCTKALLIPI